MRGPLGARAAGQRARPVSPACQRDRGNSCISSFRCPAARGQKGSRASGRWAVGSIKANTSHLSPSYGKQGERSNQLDKIEKVLRWPERLRRRQVALLGLVFIRDLLEPPAIDAQDPNRQEM